MTARAQQPGSTRRLYSRSRLVFDAPAGRTRLAVSDLGAPLRVMRGFPLEDGRLLVQVISAAPGLFSGDRYEIAVEVQPGAKVILLTPAATKIHSMPDGGFAEQHIEASVASGASLEIYPTLSIPFPESDFVQQVQVALGAEARFGWMDPWSFGRISSGERYRFRRIATRLRIDRAGKPLYRDAMELVPDDGDVGAVGLLEGASHAVAGCWFGPSEPWTPEGDLDAGLVLGTLGDDGLYARGVFQQGAAFRRALDQIHAGIAEAWALAPYSQTRFTL